MLRKAWNIVAFTASALYLIVSEKPQKPNHRTALLAAHVRLAAESRG